MQHKLSVHFSSASSWCSQRPKIVFSDLREIRKFVLISYYANSGGSETVISRIPSPQGPTYLIIPAACTQSVSLLRERVQTFMVVDN